MRWLPWQFAALAGLFFLGVSQVSQADDDSLSYRIELASPTGALQIQHAGGGFKRSREKRDAEAQAAHDAYQAEGDAAAFDALMLERFCSMLGAQCDNDNGAATITLTPVFVGYRFDQVRNTLYAPTVILDVTVVVNGKTRFDKRLGSGNIGRLMGVKRVGFVREYGYDRPAQVGYDKERSIEGLHLAAYEVLRFVIDELPK